MGTEPPEAGDLSQAEEDEQKQRRRGNTPLAVPDNPSVMNYNREPSP